MYLNLHILFCTITFTLTGADLINYQLVRDYFLQQGVKQIVVHACWSLFDRVEFARRVSQLDLQVSYLPTNHADYTDLEEYFKVNYYKLGIFVDLDCAKSEDIFYQLSRRQRHSFNETYRWLITTTTGAATDDAAAFGILEAMPLSINAEVSVAFRDDDEKADHFTFYDVYNPSYRHGGKLNVTRMGTWDPENGLVNELGQYKYKRRGNLQGMFLNFSVMVDFLPEGADLTSYLADPTVDKHLDSMHRFNYALILQLRDYYNFTMNLMRGTTWGFKVNGTFNGILGDMLKGFVDVSVTPFRWKSERIDVMEYTVQTWVAAPTVVLRHPKKNDLTNQFFKPFRREVWLLTTLVALVNWLLLYLTVKAEQHYNKPDTIATLDTIPASECALITTAAVCQQGLSDGPKLYSGRIVFISLFLWALMLFQFYSASIVGSLLAAPPRFLTTPKALLESSMELGAEDIAYNYDFFATSPYPYVSDLNKKKLSITKNRKKTYFTSEEGLKKVQKGGFAFHVDLATAYKIIEETFNEDEICDLQEIHLLPPAHTAIGMAKHSPFKKMLTYGMRQIVERGLGTRLRHVWYHRRPQCPESHNSMPTPVALQEFCPALFMLAGGLAVAVLITMVENLMRNHRNFIV